MDEIIERLEGAFHYNIIINLKQAHGTACVRFYGSFEEN